MNSAVLKKLKCRAQSIWGNLAVAMLVLMTVSCSQLGSTVRVFDSAGLSTNDRHAVIAHARSEEEFYAKEFRKEEKALAVPWINRVLSLSIEGDTKRIKVWGLYSIGDLNRGGPRFEGKKSKGEWVFWPSPINPC